MRHFALAPDGDKFHFFGGAADVDGRALLQGFIDFLEARNGAVNVVDLMDHADQRAGLAGAAPVEVVGGELDYERVDHEEPCLGG